MTRFLIGVTLLALTGCIHEPVARLAAPVNVTPDTAQVAACEKTRTWHNIWVFSGITLGAVSGAGGGVDAVVSDKTAQEAVGITAVVAGILAAVSTGAAGIEADSYATSDCAVVLQANTNANLKP